MEVAALVLSAIAVLVAVGAAWFSWQQANAAREQNKIAAEQLAIAKTEAERYRIPWRLEWRAGSTFVLVNESSDPEYNVTIIPPEHSFLDLLDDGAVVLPGSSLPFMAAYTMASPGRLITVTWRHRPGGDLLEWRDYLPMKPRDTRASRNSAL